ncbi:MAG: response regulator, partial [SAR324 cluster bacterium]|nr:response regulator [SAR324 cluster bacterium]
MSINDQHRVVRKILIVDDIEDNCLLIEDHLRHQIKCEFREASSGKGALKILENWLPDCILMDIMMPGMDGIEATRHLKAIPGCHDIPVLIVTAKQEMDSFEEAFDVGAVDYIYKPFDRTTLVARVKSALRSKEDLDRIKELNQELLQK